MFSSFAIPFSFTRPVRTDARRIDIVPVTVHQVETAAERRPRSLKHLLKANHANYSILYHNLQFHNHAPHVLGSAYILGASPEHLNAIYDSEARELEPWQDAPGEISGHDWRDYLGKREYQRAFVDFFEDQLVQYGYEWEKLLHDFMFEGREPLINCLITGLGHPLIHLGYAYELSSRTVAVEALAMTCCTYNYTHKYLDDPSYTRPASYTSSSPLEILNRVKHDRRLDGADMSASPLDADTEAALLDHWNAWSVNDDPKAQFAKSQHAAAALLAATIPPQSSELAASPGQAFDFFLVHTLTTSHAVRILLPLVPAKWQVPLVRQWWLLVLSVYVMRERPEIDLTRIDGYELSGRDWAYVIEHATGREGGEEALDAHYVKALRALKEAAETWGDEDKFFLKAAVKFADEFERWAFVG